MRSVLWIKSYKRDILDVISSLTAESEVSLNTANSVFKAISEVYDVEILHLNKNGSKNI